jgi:hypothetical protein
MSKKHKGKKRSNNTFKKARSNKSLKSKKQNLGKG